MDKNYSCLVDEFEFDLLLEISPEDQLCDRLDYDPKSTLLHKCSSLIGLGNQIVQIDNTSIE